VEIEARYGSEMQRVALGPSDDLVQFDFTTVQVIARYRPSIATCPDGTSGTPCVVCNVGAEIIKLCCS
jgi:hypothetical protein